MESKAKGGVAEQPARDGKSHFGNVEIVKKAEIDENCLFKYKKDNTIREGDLVIFWDDKDNYWPAKMKKGESYMTYKGKFYYDDIIDKADFGTKVFFKRGQGFINVIRPTSHLYTVSLPRRTQILYSPDVSMVIGRLGLKPGSVVVESGTGTGSLSVSLIRTVYPKGHLFTYEFNKQRQLKAEEDFKGLGLGPYVTSTHRDVLGEGFLLPGKVAANQVDAVFLDLPRPEQAVEHAYEVLKPKGRLCNFSPCIEQVQKACLEMAKLGFYDIRTFECLSRNVDIDSFAYNSIYKDKEEDDTKKH